MGSIRSDVMLIEEALGTVEGRLVPILSRVAEAEFNAYYANRRS